MTINFNVDPYFDDYDAAKGFLRVLFRPGYSVQGRELTQLQTILQEQVSRFGDHIFKNGSMVIPGSVNVDNKVHFMKLDDLFNNESVTSYLTQFRSKIVTGETSGVKAVIIDTSECNCMVAGDSDIPTLYFKIEDTAADGTTKRFIPGETITAYAADNTVTNNYRLETNQANDVSVSIRTFGDNGNVGTSYNGDEVTDVLGYGYGVEVKQGIYYIDGFFVQNEELHLYIGRFNNTPTARVGFEVVEEIVTPEEDPSLLDNAQGSNNFVAPGAHRYKIALQMKRLDIGSIDEIKFIELLRVVKGRVQHKVEKATYNEIEKTFARRTFDESGNYEVNKFRLSVREHLDLDGNGGVYPPQPLVGIDPLQTYGNEDQIALVIDPGKAYVNGYEVEGTISQFIAVDKARPVNGDEGNHIVRLDDQPVATQVGNYCLVTKVLGDPSIEDYVKLYLYDGTSSQNIAGTSIGTATNQSKSAPIGTARVRGIELADSSYAYPATYRLSLFDIQMDEGYTFERDVRWMTDTPNNPVPFTVYMELDHANGAKVSADGSISSSSTGNTITGSGTRFVDDFKVGDPVFGGSVYLGLVTDVISQTSMDITGTVSSALGESLFRGISRLYEPEKASLIFPTGYDATRTLLGYDTATGQDVIKSSTQVVRRQQTIASDLNSVVTLQLANQNEFFLSNSDLENFFLIDQTTNEVEEITASDISFVNPATRKEITISVSNPSRSYFFIYSVLQINAAASARTKQKATTTQNFLTRKNATAKRLKLDHADIYEIVSVKMIPGDFAATDFSNAIDVTNRYRLDNGQRATHYQAGTAILRDGATPASGAIQVEYTYYAYGNAGNYFSVDSYIDTDYEDIPDFEIQTPEGNTITTFLHDAIDYRPVIEGLNAYHPELPKIGTDFNTSLSYYVPRQDKIVLDSVGRINVVKGVPSINPRQPEDPKEGMVLATLLMPAYTKQASDVKIFQRDNRRYTMKDIGNIERRVANLEYYVSLNMLEKETQAYTIKDGVTGLDRFKNGFIVDPFLGHGIGDVQHPDYRVSVDKSKGVLRPMHFTEAVDIIENLESTQQRASRNYQRTGDVLTLPYTEERFIFNPNASRTIDVNPYKIGAFKGEVTLNPAGDNWKETDRRPDLQVTDDNGFDAIQYLAEELGVTGTEWEEWQNNWTGRSVERETWETGNRNQRRQTVTGYERTTVTETGTASREGIRTSLTSSVNTMDYGDRVVDVSYMPYIRPRPVLYTVKNLKANTRFYSFFDDTRVDSDFMQPADVFKVTKQTGAVANVWDPTLVNNAILADSTARAYNGEIQPAFSIGDVVRNATHTAVTIQSIANVTNPTGATSFTVTVSDATGISIGHHVTMYNLSAERASPTAPSLDDNAVTQSFRTTITDPTKNTSSEINRRRFLVSNVSGNTVTLRNIDGTLVQPFSAYDNTAYAAGDGGRLLRLRASGVVAFEGVAESADTKYVHVVNIKNGFAIGENISGDVDIGGGSRNQAVLNEINGNSVNTSLPVMKKVGDAIRTDTWGSCIGVFFIPEATFRTGERSLKFIDNISNSDADFDSKGSAIYAATGLTLAKERTVVNSRDIQFVEDRLYEEIPIRRTTTSTRQLYSFYTGHDPVAQTFVVSSEGGAMISSIDVFFSEAGNRPITVELRTTNNGVPTSKIMPFTTVTKNPEEVNLSDDGSVATNFKFGAPVYLLDNETYALVVKTDEPGCQMFVSELGKTDVVTQNIITSQPLTGSLYLSQNSREFEINPLLDMKFTMYRCEFDTSVRATVELKATPPLNSNLVRDPFEFAPNTTNVRVYHRNHGFSAGDTVVISGVAEGYYGSSSNTVGVPAPLLNGSHTVQATGITTNSFIIDMQTSDSNGNTLLSGTTADFVKGRYGGVNIKSTRQLWADYQFIKSNDIAWQDTTLSWFVDAEDASGSRTGYQPTLANETHEFPTRQIVKSFENQVVLTAAPLIKAPSLKIRAQMSSGNSAVSPIIDLQKLAVYAIQNLIDNKTAASLNVEELDSNVILNDNTIVAGDAVLAGTGTIVSTNSTNIVGGFGTKFQTEVRVGDIIRTTSGDAIGVVSFINGDDDLELHVVGQVGYSGAYQIVAPGQMQVTNANNKGNLKIWIDSADNAMANITIGSQINLNNFSFLTGTYQVENILEYANSARYAGSNDGNVVELTLTGSLPVLNSSTVFVNLIHDFVEFEMSGSYTISNGSDVLNAAGVTPTQLDAEVDVGDTIVAFDDYEVTTPFGSGLEYMTRTVLGTVDAVGADVTLTANSTITPNTPNRCFVRKSLTNWEVAELSGFVDDYAPTGATNAANYVTRPLVLSEPADSIRWIFEANIPQNAILQIWYKTYTAGDNPEVIRWNQAAFNPLTKDAVDIYSEREVNVENIDEFTIVQMKFVMKSSNSTYVPKVRNLRMITHS